MSRNTQYKTLGAEEDELGSSILDNLIVKNIEVTDNAEFNGSVFVSTLDINSLGSYEQTGPVDFNNQELSNMNIVSGNMDGIDIGTTTQGKGGFTTLNSGVSGTGYDVYFYGNDTAKYFRWNGSFSTLNVSGDVGFDIPFPDGKYHFAPLQYNFGKVEINDGQTIPQAGLVVTGSSGVTFPTDIIGHYLVLNDGTRTKITQRLTSNTLLCDGINSTNTGILKTAQEYTIHYPGIIIDSYGNFNDNGTGALKLPSGTTAERPTNLSTGQLRINKDFSEFEGYNGSNWVTISGGGSLYNTSRGSKIELTSENKLIINLAGQNTLIVNQSKLGINTEPSVTLDISGTDAIKVPVGTTVQRPTASVGMLRYNSTDTRSEEHTS